MVVGEQNTSRVSQQEEGAEESNLFSKFGQAGQARTEAAEALARYRIMAQEIQAEINDANPESLVVVVAKKSTEAVDVHSLRFVLGERKEGEVVEVDDAVVVTIPRNAIVSVDLEEAGYSSDLVLGVHNDDPLSTSASAYFTAIVPVGHPDVAILLQD